MAPGATAATSLVPNGVTSRIASGTSSPFSARTATYALPARQRVLTVTSTASAGSASVTVTGTSTTWLVQPSSTTTYAVYVPAAV